MGLLDGDIADIVNTSMDFMFLDAVLTRDVPGVIGDPADPAPPTQTTFACKAIEDEYETFARAQGLVSETDISVLILANSLATDPKPLDRITIRGKTVTIIPGGSGGIPAVKSDPARATWSCRCRS
jgi:hypothetical protein